MGGGGVYIFMGRNLVMALVRASAGGGDLRDVAGDVWREAARLQQVPSNSKGA